MEILKKLLTGPMGVFVYGILSKWYLMIAVSGVVVAFWVFKGLDKSGILQATEKVVTKALGDTKSVAKYCTPKILNLSEFWDCLENPPDYDPDESEKQLQQQISDEQKKLSPTNNTNSYDSNNPYDSQ